MIVREIKVMPQEILADFDWFNDYKDTVKWCKVHYPEIVPALNEGYEKWRKQHHEQIMREIKAKDPVNQPARLDLRTNQYAKTQIEIAADMCNMTVTDFVLKAARDKAKTVIEHNRKQTVLK